MAHKKWSPVKAPGHHYFSRLFYQYILIPPLYLPVASLSGST